MRNARHARAAAPDEQRVQTQRALGAMLVPLVVLSVSRKLERKRERADDAGPAAAVVGAAA